MIRKLVLMLLFASLLLAGCQTTPGGKATAKAGQWQSLFDGKSLDGWQASENKDTFTVRSGMIIAHGPRSHLFYVGPVNDANFTDFEFKADVLTTPGSNSGIYFHTAYQETGWPDKGFECQVNTTHSDPKKTGGLYNVQDVMNNAPSVDDKWFHYYIRVEGKHVIIQIDGKTTAAWTQPEDWTPPQGMPGRKIGEGTFALQGHDPDSVVYYKNIMVRVPPQPMDMF
jgi:predicted small secreted protein